MDRLRERIDIAKRALATLTELAYLQAPTAVERDAAIQRFEYTHEAMWKAAQRYLDRVEGVIAESPRGVVRACAAVGLLTPEQAEKALEMVDDRNLSVHAYNEDLAASLYLRLASYVGLMKGWLAKLDQATH